MSRRKTLAEDKPDEGKKKGNIKPATVK